MANRVLFKKSSVAARVPLSADLEYGEIAINYADEKIYIKNSSNAIKSFNAGASVSSVALSLPAIFTVSGSPVTTSGTLTATLASQTANTILAAPNGAAGTPTFRALVSGDLPATYSPAGTLTIGTAGQTTTMLGNISAITSNQTITLSPTGTGTITVNPAVAGNINNMNIGATTRGTGAFTTLGANNTVTISTATNNQTYSTTGAGTITISSGTAGSIDNMTIGGTTPAVGTFSQLRTYNTYTDATNYERLTVSWLTNTAAINAEFLGTGVQRNIALQTVGGNVGIGTASPAYKLQVVGSFAATTKSFLIDHPTKEGMKLRYGSLESPYHGVRLTGEGKLVNGICTISLPDYLHGLCHQEGSQVQITNIKHGKVIWVDDINVDEDYFIVKADVVDMEYKFYWSFTAIRKDIEEMIVES